MKPNEISIRYLTIDILRKIDEFDKSDRWEIIKASLEFLEEDKRDEIFSDITSLIPKNTMKELKRKRKSLQEPEEEYFDKSDQDEGNIDLLSFIESEREYVRTGYRPRNNK